MVSKIEKAFYAKNGDEIQTFENFENQNTLETYAWTISMPSFKKISYFGVFILLYSKKV